MLVAFLGSPCSGKTTTAARLFAELKEAGIPTEFITEYARIHIAKKRCEILEEEIILHDDDQITIMTKQHELERIFAQACGTDVVVIVDGCALNALFYMNSTAKDEPLVHNVTKSALKLYDIVFICEPIQTFDGLDPNRVHNFEQSIGIHKIMDKMVNDGCLKGMPGCLLVGDTATRLQSALRRVYTALME